MGYHTDLYPTAAWDAPRWQTDGYYYEPYTGNSYKFSLTLKGPSTLFYSLSEIKRDEFYALQNKNTAENEPNRQDLAELLAQSPVAILVAKLTQGSVFIVGPNIAAVHSDVSYP
jgi:hypothetical protein